MKKGDILTINKHDLHVKLLLRQLYAIQAKQYTGDYGAVVLLTDLEMAIKQASLTDRQREVLCLVYAADLTQSEAGASLNISQQAIEMAVKAGIRKIANVYEIWSNKGCEKQNDRRKQAMYR